MKLIVILIILVNCTSVVNGEMGFCYCHSCSENEGDCDSNEECQDGLICGSKNCHVSLGFANYTDCCYMPGLGDEHFCSTINNCGDNEGDCDSNDECQDGLACGANNCHVSLGFANDTDCCYMPALGDEHFCSPINTCGDNEGDCDSSDECRNNYFCGSNNCPDSLGFDSELDCCYLPAAGDEHFCTTDNPCAIDEGDCDSNSECEANLVCDITISCPSYLGFASDVNCCSNITGSKFVYIVIFGLETCCHNCIF